MRLGIDPGKAGGWAIDSLGSVRAIRMPETEGDVVELVEELACEAALNDEPIIAAVEDVPKYVGRCVPSSSAFVLARNFGHLLGVLQACGVRLEMLRPQEWQKRLGLGTSRGMKPTAWKNKLKARAQQLFPGLKVTLATADALLILEASKLEGKR